MLTMELTTWDGGRYKLPTLISWDFICTGSVPCDSFSAVCLYDRSMADVLPRAVGFTALDGGQIVLRGVVDAYEISMSSKGLLVSLEGRGMAALLLDNESTAVTYGEALLPEILKNHVEPYKIDCTVSDKIPGIPYKVPSGSSQWSALRGYIHRAAGFDPYFTRGGTLVIGRLWGSGQTISLEDDDPILSLSKREQRYGVISEVLIQDKTQRVRRRVMNEPFASQGGCRRHVLYMPRSTMDQWRYTGEYQIQRSAQGQVELTLVLPSAFAAFPGDRVSLRSRRLGLSETYDVISCRSLMDGKGETSTLTLSVR